MKLNWFVPGVLSTVSALVISSPAAAARLQFWQFNTTNNQLTFTTDTGVQPRAQLIPDPTRLVIDLPGTTLSTPPTSQLLRATGFREVRIGQFDAQTARIVIELNAGYTVDPQQIQIRGITPSQWTVQLPAPERTESVAPTAEAPPNPEASPNPTVTPAPGPATPVVTGAATQLESLRVTPDGLFLRTSGATAELELNRSRDRRQINIDLQNTALSSQLQPEIAINRFGVDRIQFTQVQASPPIARVTLNLADDNSREWQVTSSNLGGVVLVPTGGVASSEAPPPTPEIVSEPEPEQPATIQAIDLETSGNQLLIRADRPLTYTSGWDRSTAAYQVTLPNAQLASEVTGPQLDSSSPLLRVRLRQEENAVIVLVQPAAGVTISEVTQPSNQLLAVQLQRTDLPARPSSGGSISVTPPPRTNYPNDDLPSVPNSRVVVVVDPGHGGPDPGAIGINGLREKDIVLPVSLEVASILQQQGLQVIMTRQDDRDLDLEPRVQIAERANADLFVSIHANAISLSRPDVNGVETYYYSSGGQRLAQVVHNSIIQTTGQNDRGVRQARFYVIRNTSMPAILVETGFVTGRDDAQLLADSTFRSQMAAAIARGILQYVQQNF